MIVDDREQQDQDRWVRRLRVDSADRDMAIAELRDYLVRGLSRSLTHRYGGHPEVEDVVQLALLKILASLDTFRSNSRFTTWATAIAVRIGISQLRRHYYRDISLDTSPHGEMIRIEMAESSSAAGVDHAARNNLFALLQKLIDESLTEKQRVAIRGTLDGLPIEEIAVRLQSNRNAVYKLVHDARLKLREGFETLGVTVDDIQTNIL